MEEFLSWLENRAQQLRADAGFSGSQSDFGAQALEEQVQIYRQAQAGEVPLVWRKLLIEFERERDPQYQEFLRLKEIFEGKK